MFALVCDPTRCRKAVAPRIRTRQSWPASAAAGEDHEFGKDQFGYDHAQVRLYAPVMRHLTLVMAALAICAVTTAELRDTSPAPPVPTRAGQLPPEDQGLIPFTVPEIKRLYMLFHQTWHSIAHGLHWSRWRRRHQARARWYHHRARLRDLETYP